MISVLFFTASVTAVTLSDSLLIEGYYSQQGKSISRRELEYFLREKSVSESLINRSKRYRLSAWTIGAGMWCVNTGITIYQIKKFVDAVENQEPVSTSLDNVTIPLVIGGEISVFVQNRLRIRSDYLLHKAVTAYNNDMCKKFALDLPMDHLIKKEKYNWYKQDRVLMPTRVLYPVLKEKDASRPLANWSIVCRESASHTIAIGAMFIVFAAIGYIEEEGIDIRKRNVQLGVGIGLTSFGIINAIISAVTRNTAIRKYNESIPESTQPVEDQPALE